MDLCEILRGRLRRLIVHPHTKSPEGEDDIWHECDQKAAQLAYNTAFIKIYTFAHSQYHSLAGERDNHED